MKHYRYIPLVIFITLLSGCADMGHKDRLMRTEAMATQATADAATARQMAENAALRAEQASNDAAMAARAASDAEEKANRIFSRSGAK